MNSKSHFRVFLFLGVVLLAVLSFGEPQIVVTQITIPTTQTFFQPEPLPEPLPEIPITYPLPMITAEPDWAVFPNFDLDFNVLNAIRKSSGFFIEDGTQFRIQQNLIPISAFKKMYDLVSSGATITFTALSEDIRKVLSDEVNLSLIEDGEMHFGYAFDRVALGLYGKTNTDSLVALPSWIFEYITQPTVYPPSYPASHSVNRVLDFNVSAGFFGTVKLDFLQFAAEVGMYTPIMTADFDQYYELITTPISLSGTATIEGQIYSGMGDFSLTKLPSALLSGGWKGDFSVIFGKEKTLAGFSVSNLPFTSAKLNYIAPWDLDGTFYDDLTVPATYSFHTTQKLNWVALGVPLTYQIKPVYAGFVNIPFGEIGYFQFHGKWRTLAEMDVGGSLHFFFGEGFSIMGDLTYNTQEFYYYTLGLGFYNGQSRFNLDVGIGANQLFNFAALSSPRISISSSFIF